MTKNQLRVGRSVGVSGPYWREVFACLAALLAVHGAAVAEPRPTRGGILEFAVDAEPPNYDCHAN
ncbi:MAG: hypothetical protein JO358_04665, partial [Alphaproteobacteria bacterium]|nr:hypothetical protein [Alphaproteobacteria bacterium]